MSESTAQVPTVLYLGGLGRSGTTLIERLLGELPGICSMGEVVHLWQRGIAEDERCGCGTPFRECPFWQRVGESAFAGWDEVDVSRVAALTRTVARTRHIPRLAKHPRGRYRAALTEYLSYYRSLYGAVREVSGCRAVVDSSKHAALALCLSRSPGMDLRVIHVVRDSRAVAYSWAKAVRRPDAATESFMTRWSPWTSATQWNLQNAALHLLARTGAPSLRVRYEDLARDPVAVVADIARFAGVEPDREALRFLGGGEKAAGWAELGVHHTASGNPMRFTTGRITIKPDDAWRDAMPRTQQRAVTMLTLPLLARYGYLQRSA